MRERTETEKEKDTRQNGAHESPKEEPARAASPVSKEFLTKATLLSGCSWACYLVVDGGWYSCCSSCQNIAKELQAVYDRAVHETREQNGRELKEVRAILDELLIRIVNGHKQSIGSIDNVRMVQFNIDEIDRLAAAIRVAASPEREP